MLILDIPYIDALPYGLTHRVMLLALALFS